MQTDLVTGETLNYTVSVAEYVAADGWVLRLVLSPRAGGTVYTVDSVPGGDDHLLTVSAAVTATWAPGQYAWEIWALRNGEQYRLEAGQIRVLAGLLGATGGQDTRSEAEQGLQAIDALLAGKATSGVQRYTINGRELQSYSLTELLKLRQHLVAEVASQRRAAGIVDERGSVRRILVRTR